MQDKIIEKITKLAIGKLGGKSGEDIKNKIEEITKLSLTEENLSKISEILEELPVNNIYRLEEKVETISLWQIVSSLFSWGWILLLLFLPFIYYEEFMEFMEKIDNPYGTLIYILATALYLSVLFGVLSAVSTKWRMKIKQLIIKLYFLIKRYLAEMFVILGAYLIGTNSVSKQHCEYVYHKSLISLDLLGGGGRGGEMTCWNINNNKWGLVLGWIILALGIIFLANKYLPKRDKKN